MFTSSPLYFPGFGPSATGPFTISLPGACITLASSFDANGSFTNNLIGNYCEHATGSGTANSHHPFGMVIEGPTITFTGTVQGTLQMHPDITGGQSCISGATRFLVSGSVALTGSTAPCTGAGLMHTSTPMYFPGFGPSATGPFVIDMPGACLTLGASFNAAGNFTNNGVGNYCEFATGTGVANGTHSFTMTVSGPTITFGGSVQGTLQMHPDVTAGESCISGADRFVVSGSVILL